MPRPNRYTKLLACHHVMLRGNGGQLIFLNDQDRIRFCFYLEKAAVEYETVIHAYCFMNNHVHLILEPKKIDLSKCVQSFAGNYAQYFNRRHKLRGHLFQDRFNSILIQDGDYLKRVVRYIHLNPVRANLISEPQNYIWSSYCAYIGITQVFWLSQNRILKMFGNTFKEARQELVCFTSRKMESEMDVSIVRASNQLGAFGCEEFLKEILDLNRCDKPEISVNNLIDIAKLELKCTLEELSSEIRDKRLVDARSILAFAVQKVQGLNLQELECLLKRSPSSLSRLAKRARESHDLTSQTAKLIEKASYKG